MHVERLIPRLPLALHLEHNLDVLASAAVLATVIYRIVRFAFAVVLVVPGIALYARNFQIETPVDMIMLFLHGGVLSFFYVTTATMNMEAPVAGRVVVLFQLIAEFATLYNAAVAKDEKAPPPKEPAAEPTAEPGEANFDIEELPLTELPQAEPGAPLPPLTFRNFSAAIPATIKILGLYIYWINVISEGQSTSRNVAYTFAAVALTAASFAYAMPPVRSLRAGHVIALMVATALT